VGRPARFLTWGLKMPVRGLDKGFWKCYASSMPAIDMQKGTVLGVRDAASRIGVHYTTLYRWIQAGEVAFVTFGDTVFIPLIEVKRLEARQKNHGNS